MLQTPLHTSLNVITVHLYHLPYLVEVLLSLSPHLIVTDSVMASIAIKSQISVYKFHF